MNLIYIYVAGVNLLAFYLYYYDKKLAKHGTWRISEKNLLVIALLGGSIGALIACRKFRHKTKKWSFKIFLYLILLAQAGAFFLKSYFSF